MKKILEEIRKRMELSLDYPELGTVIDLSAIIILLSERKSIGSRWKELIKSCPDILLSIQYPREVVTPSVITSISNYYSILPITPHVPCVDIILQLEIMETLIKDSSEDCRERIEAFISQLIAHILTLT